MFRKAPRWPPRRVLLSCTQRLGDVLLATPLLRSLQRAWPQTKIDVLLFADTAAVLEGNPDVAAVIGVARRASPRERLGELASVWRRYDLALSPLPTDRARLYCIAAAPYRLGLLRREPAERPKGWLFDAWRYFDDLDTHSVTTALGLAELLGIAAVAEVVPPALADGERQRLQASLAPAGERYAVLHCEPSFNYKRWTPGGWLELAAWLRAQGLGLVFTGSAALAERQRVAAIAAACGGLDRAGQLSLAEVAEAIGAAVLYVGPDTVTTHIAAATGTATVALFGPTNPVKWGPWPRDWEQQTSPWARVGSGRRGNVYLLQGEDARGCVPCLQEGCERRVDSASACLQTLAASRVIAACAAMLAP